MTPDFDSLYLYKVIVKRIIDGDTVDLLVDLGFQVFQQQRFRLYGINTPEKKLDTYKAGVEAELFLGKLINPASTFSKDLFSTNLNSLYIVSHKDGADKYGRWLADLYTWIKLDDPNDPKTARWCPEGTGGVWTNINQLMIQAGHAVPYLP